MLAPRQRTVGGSSGGSDAVESAALETTGPPPTFAEKDFPLGIDGFTYQDLHREERLVDLDRAFLEELGRENAALHARLIAYRSDPASFDPLSCSRLLVDAARPLGGFIARLFGVEKEWREQGASSGPEAVLFRFRRDFLQRRAVKAKLPDDPAGCDIGPLGGAAEEDPAGSGRFPGQGARPGSPRARVLCPAAPPSARRIRRGASGVPGSPS